jgi:hypothetical protein
VYKDGDDLYALDNEDMSTTDPDTQNVVDAVHFAVTSSGAITTDDESLVWNITSSSGNWIIKPANGDNTARFLYPGTTDSSLYLRSSSRTWTYEEGKLSYTRSGSDTCYLMASSAGFQLDERY